MNHPADVLNLLRMHGGNRHDKVTHEKEGGTGYMVGQSAAATGQGYVYDPRQLASAIFRRNQVR